MSKFTIPLIAMTIFLFTLAATSQSLVFKPTKIDQNIHYDVSPPVHEMKSFNKEDAMLKAEVHKPKKPTKPLPNEDPNYMPVDKYIQDHFNVLTSSASPTVEMDFEGINRADIDTKYSPPDTHGDVGPNHYVQAVNAEFKIWDKAGNVLVENLPIKTLFEAGGFDNGQPFEDEDPIDPVVHYDEYADRWLIAGFTFASSPYIILIAVSTSPDPTGTYYRYAYDYGSTLPDYEKFGVWHDGYYMTTNNFYQNQGAAMRVFDRDAMLAGEATVSSPTFNFGTNYFGFLPSDADGELPPPNDLPHASLAISSTTINTLDILTTQMDWSDIGNSTTTFNTVEVEPFVSGNYAYQPGNDAIDGLSDRLMYRLQYRNFGTHHSWVVNHTVRNTTTNVLGIRWYEFRDNGDGFAIHQQGTLMPDDNTHRWMGSIAMNGNGDIALGYSVTNSVDVYPSIRFTGQTSGAPDGLGVMDKPETTIVAGTATYFSSNRWGDYSSMTVDPSDDYTFWYTQEYSTDASMWATRIGKIDLETPFCGVPEELSASNITSAGADLTWNEAGTSTAWEVILVPAGVDPSGKTPLASLSTTYAATGLMANSGYDWYVRADCSAGNYSDWAGPHTFYTNLPACASWDFVGAADFSSGSNSFVSMALDDSGTPYVCFTETTNEASVMTFNGTAWAYVGEEGFTAGTGYRPDIAVHNNMPYVVFEDGTASSKTSVMRFNGTDWEYVGSPGFKWGLNAKIEFNDDTPYVAFIDRDNSDQVSVMRFVSGSWEYVGPAGFTNFTNTGIDLAIDNGTPYVVYQDQAAGQKAAVYEFNGSWTLVGADYATASDANGLALAVHDGNVFLAFRQFISGNYGLSVRVFDGTWSNVGDPGFSTATVNTIDIATRQGNPYVSFGNVDAGSKATVQRFNGAAWESVGTAGFSAGTITYASLAIFNGLPYMAYTDFSSDGKVNLQRYSCCTAPGDLMAENITENTANLAWTENGTSSSWEIRLGENGFDPETATPTPTTENPYPVNNLTSGTSYDFYVRSDCGLGEYSDWTGPYTFETLYDVPVAICMDVSVAAGENCTATVTPENVDNGSYDPGGNAITLSLSPEGPYPFGDTEVTLTASNGVNESTCNATISVTEVPQIEGPDILLLWPPNHKYESVSLAQLIDNITSCSGYSVDDVRITAVSSDEPEDAPGNGDGNTTEDILISSDCQSIQIRRERDKYANGRVYTVYMELDYGSGTPIPASCQLHVPIGINQVAVDDGMAYQLTGNCDEKAGDSKGGMNNITYLTQLSNYPNPFTGSTTIEFVVSMDNRTQVKVYNSIGNEIITLYDDFAEAGKHYSLEFKAGQLPEGMYFYHLQSGNEIHEVRKMVIMK